MYIDHVVRACVIFCLYLLDGTWPESWTLSLLCCGYHDSAPAAAKDVDLQYCLHSVLVVAVLVVAVVVVVIEIVSASDPSVLGPSPLLLWL